MALALLKGDSSTIYRGRAEYRNLDFYKAVGKHHAGSISIKQIIPHGDGWVVIYVNRFRSPLGERHEVVQARVASVLEPAGGGLSVNNDIIIS